MSGAHYANPRPRGWVYTAIAPLSSPWQGAGGGRVEGRRRKGAPPASPRKEALFVKYLEMFSSIGWKRLAKQKPVATGAPAPLRKTFACSGSRESIKKGDYGKVLNSSECRLSVTEKDSLPQDKRARADPLFTFLCWGIAVRRDE